MGTIRRPEDEKEHLPPDDDDDAAAAEPDTDEPMGPPAPAEKAPDK